MANRFEGITTRSMTGYDKHQESQRPDREAGMIAGRKTHHGEDIAPAFEKKNARLTDGAILLEKFLEENTGTGPVDLTEQLADEIRFAMAAARYSGAHRFAFKKAEEDRQHVEHSNTVTVTFDSDTFNGLAALLGLPKIDMPWHGSCETCIYGPQDRGWDSPCASCGTGHPCHIEKQQEE